MTQPVCPATEQLREGIAAEIVGAIAGTAPEKKRVNLVLTREEIDVVLHALAPSIPEFDPALPQMTYLEWIDDGIDQLASVPSSIESSVAVPKERIAAWMSALAIGNDVNRHALYDEMKGWLAGAPSAIESKGLCALCGDPAEPMRDEVIEECALAIEQSGVMTTAHPFFTKLLRGLKEQFDIRNASQ